MDSVWNWLNPNHTLKLKAARSSQMLVSYHKTAQHNTTQHNTTPHNATHHNKTQHNTTQHNTTQHNATRRHDPDDHDLNLHRREVIKSLSFTVTHSLTVIKLTSVKVKFLVICFSVRTSFPTYLFTIYIIVYVPNFLSIRTWVNRVQASLRASSSMNDIENLVRKLQRKRLLARLKSRWKTSIKMDRREIVFRWFKTESNGGFLWEHVNERSDFIKAENLEQLRNSQRFTNDPAPWNHVS
jgi:hypothetical protein